MASNPQILFVGYEISPLSTAPPEFVPHFEEPKTKGAKSADEKRKEWLAEFVRTPYGASLSRVVIIDPTKELVLEFDEKKNTYRPAKWPKDTKVPVAVQVAGWLDKHYGKTLAPTLLQELANDAKYTGKVAMLGFEPRRFVKHLGLECARLGHPMKTGFWYAASDYRDMDKAILPEPYSAKFELEMALQSCGLTRRAYTPGTNALADAKLALRIALFLGLIAQERGGDTLATLAGEPEAEPTPEEPATEEPTDATTTEDSQSGNEAEQPAEAAQT